MKAGSPRGAQTRRRIMEVAFDLFHLKGVAATSPDEIIEASGTGKGQFYYYFHNKQDLVHQVLENYLDLIETGGTEVKHDIESWQELELWFLQHIAVQERFNMQRACPFGTMGIGLTTMGIGLTEQDDLIRADLCRIFEAVSGRLAAFFTREKAQGRLSADANEEALAEYCLAVMQGALFMGKIKRSRHTVEAVVREALAHLKQSVRPAA